MRTFDTWTYEQVEDSFGLIPLPTSPEFELWLKAENINFDNWGHQTLTKYRNLLFEEAKNWTADELNFFFIGPVLSLVNFNSPHFKPFAKRTLTIETETVSASGKVDFLLAKGKMIPKLPYFCLHEYKQENRRENDPLGQLLIAMVAAQYKNEHSFPIYGCYVSGRNWFFVLLDGKNYCLSDAYVATSDDIFKIFAILKKSRLLMENHAMQLSN